MRLRSLALLTAAAVLTTSACVPTSTETRPQPRPSVSPEEVTPIATPDDAPEISVVDSSPGGAKESDPMWQGLAQAAAEKKPAYLKTWVHTANPDLPDSGEVTVTPDSPNSVSVTLDAGNVTTDKAPFVLIHGLFDVEEIGESAYTLTTSPNSIRRDPTTRPGARPTTPRSGSPWPPTTSPRIRRSARSSASSGVRPRRCGGASR